MQKWIPTLIRARAVWCVLLGAWCHATPATAQALGTFRWQMQPYCNVVVLTVTANGGVFRLDGTDDQCGGADKASAVGTAFANPDGSIGVGLTIVSPGATPVHVDASLPAGGFDGTWRDNAGNRGTFRFTPGAGTGGSARPLPAAGVPPAIRLQSDGGMLATGTPGVGVNPASGPGTRLAWHPGKAAFRSGRALGAEWDDDAVGRYSLAAGDGTTADGISSAALGLSTHASGQASLALGDRSVASGFAAVAMGEATTASGGASVALGQRTVASGDYAVAAGTDARATGRGSVSIGNNITSAGAYSVALGSNLEIGATSPGTFVFGDQSTTLLLRTQLPNQFIVRATGGVAFYSSSGPTRSGVQLLPGSGAWSVVSDVTAKEHFRDWRADDVLARFASLPVREWNYKTQDASIRHMGPTAQDFHAAFGLGEDARYISTVDADGVALAGVKALEGRTRTLMVENGSLRGRIDELSLALDELRVQLGRDSEAPNGVGALLDGMWWITPILAALAAGLIYLLTARGPFV